MYAISFHFLEESDLLSKTKSYNSRLLSDKHITHIGKTAVLPYDCYPNMICPDGEHKDNLNNLYNKYKLSFHKNSEEENTICENLIEDEIKKRWCSGKSGRWRQDICGKRCDFSARSVLTPNPYLSLIQIGIPMIWRRIMTIEEEYKIDKNINIISIVDKLNRNKYDPRYRKPEHGDLIIRELNEGELVLVNRQPTLRESNFVAMEVFWIKKKTIQMHPALFSMFDADCDGDEINIHLPQVRQEELYSLHITKAIINYGNNSLTPSVVQDAVVGKCLNSKFTNKNNIHTSVLTNNPINTLNNIFNVYKDGCNTAYTQGFSVGFDFNEVDFMIDTGAKGKKKHKEKIRSMLTGVYDDNTHFKDCQLARLAMISISLKTADTGYISRRLPYHLDDVKQDKFGICTDLDKMIIQYPTKLDSNVRHIKNIGLYLVSVIMPPLTQKMLDSFHTASVGESLENEISKFVSLINCSSIDLKDIYKTKGILYTKKWLFKEFDLFFKNDIKTQWIQLLVDFLCVNGERIGIGIHSLKTRIDKYTNFDETLNIPIIKLCKFGTPYKNITRAAKKSYYDDLNSYHSVEFFK